MNRISPRRARLRRLGAAVASATVVIATISGCSTASEEPVATGGTLVIRQEIPPVLDPAFMESDRQRTIISNLFEPLVRMSPEGEVVPALAESWEESDGGRTWTFQIRSDAKFSDGSALTADDVVYSLTRAVTPVTAEEQQALGVTSASPKGLAVLPDVVGVAEISRGEAETLPEDSIEALDERTVVVRLQGASADILARLAYPALGVVQSDNVEGSAVGQPWWYTPVASGPFQLEELEAQSLVRLTPNSNYFGTVSGLDAVEFRVVEDSQTAIVAWEAGDMDIVKVQTTEVQNLRDAGNEAAIVTAQDSQTVVLIANPIGATADTNVLRALLMAIDKDTLASALDGLVTPAYTFTSPVSPGYNIDGVPVLEFDADDAKAELARSGFAPADVVINVVKPGSLDDRALPIIAQMWEQNLGITVNILTEMPPATAPEGQAANLVLGAQGPNYTGTCAMARRWPDFITFASGANNANFGAIEGRGLEAIVEECTTAPNDEAAWEAVREFETLLTEYPQFLPVWYGNSYYLVSPEVQGIQFGNNWNIVNLPEVVLSK